MFAKILSSTLIFMCLHLCLMAQSNNSASEEELWLMQMKNYISSVPENIDSIRRLGLEHLEECPLGELKEQEMQSSLLAEVYYYQQDFNGSLNSYQEALRFSVEAEDSSNMAVYYNNIGLIHYLQANFDSALIAYNSSLEIELRNNNKIGVAQCYQNLGILYGRWERYDHVIEFYDIALEIYTELGKKMSMADMNNNMAVIAMQMGDSDLAFEYYKRAFEIFQELGDDDKKATVFSNVGRLFFKREEYTRAKEYFDSALSIFHRIDNKIGLVHTYSMLGEMYLAEGKLNEALIMYQHAEDYNKSIGLREVQQDNLEELYQAYKKLGKYQEANVVLEKSYALKDSIFANEHLENLLVLENKYNNEKTEKELIILKAKEERNRLFMWGVSIFFFFATILVLVWVYVLKMREKQRSVAMEHKVLRTQMNPHFIFNALSALQCIILENNKEEAIEFVADFSGLMRLVLQYAKEEQITLKKEKEILDCYMSLQNRRFDDQINYEINFDENIELDKVTVPPMLTQPFLENAIEHGQLTKSDSYIHVNLKRIANTLEFSIEDNGIGIKNSMKESKIRGKGHKSVAMGVTKERLELLNRKDDVSIKFKVEDLSDYGRSGTRVIFQVPYIELN